MKLCVLAENTAASPEFEAEHGLSLWIETQGHRILFDAGQSDLFARNAQRMGVDLQQAQWAVLSHGHYDHGNGMPYFLAQNETAPVYVSRHAFEPFYSGQEKYIGLNPEWQEHPRLVLTEGETQLAPGIKLCQLNHRPMLAPSFGQGLTRLADGVHRPDTFLHEQYLLVEENGKKILISGCSHRGVVNLMTWLKPDILVGGFHLKGIVPEGHGKEVIARIALGLNRFACQYYTCHCTGEAVYGMMKAYLGDKLQPLRSGDVLEL